MLRPVKSTKSAMFGLILTSVTAAGLSCSTASTPQETETFEAGTGDSFGTLTDADAGTFEINMNEDGAVSGITVEGATGESGGEVSLPTAEEPSLGVTAPDGGSTSVVTKLADRGSWQTVGIVTDVEPFFHELLTRLDH